MNSQPDFHTSEEIDQLVEGIYRALETTEERLDRGCDDIYFPMNLTISALTSKIEAIQGELVDIQSYTDRRPEALASIDRRNNKSTDIHRQTSVDNHSGQRLHGVAPVRSLWCAARPLIALNTSFELQMHPNASKNSMWYSNT
ncbi:hypothetical protein F2Q69_00027885 [Brassica cretica]|uniref:Uncharacterized protein n=1 Tax=Brassica cretica TaxID=69181 RepID=A0A8S9S0T8_BRACR|nr:hypothetical protein F2Q69_00027885 [Brassica cretica]